MTQKGSIGLEAANGLIRFTDPAGERHDAIWYRMGDKTYPLSHNRIRHIYEDKEQQLWIATDGSINRYDYATRQFIHYNIVDNTGTYNTNWTYYMFEDTAGQLWISTCLGGIFVVDKHKLMQSTSGQYVAEQNYSVHNGLSGMFINQIIPDNEGNVWVLLYNNKGIDKINPRTREVTKLFADELSGEKSPNYLLCDEDGYALGRISWRCHAHQPQRREPAEYLLRKFQQQRDFIHDLREELHLGIHYQRPLDYRPENNGCPTAEYD